MIETVTDPDDPRLAEYTRLTDVALRRVLEPAAGIYMAESSQVIKRALAAGHRARSFLMAPRWLESMQESIDLAEQRAGHELPVWLGDDELLRSITGFHLHRGALAVMERPELPAVQDVLAGPGAQGRGVRRVAVLEDIVDHTNVGAMIRSAAALGVDAVLVTPKCADPLYRRSVRVSMGTVFQVPWTRIDPWPAHTGRTPREGSDAVGIDLLRTHGFTVAALALSDDAVSLDEFTASPEVAGPDSKVALVLGTEGDGLSRRTVDGADVVVRIPMMGGVDSLNVAAASAVAFYATRAQ